MTDFLHLSDLCERAEGPDRELDCEIAVLTQWRWDGWGEGDLKVEERDLASLKDRVLNSSTSIFRHLPTYTASIDAAMSLVPKGRGWMLEYRDGRGHAVVAGDNPSYRSAATPALALCSAALRALHKDREG